MIVKGKRTDVSYVDVEINIFSILINIREKSTPSGAEYLRDGKWFVSKASEENKHDI